MMESKGDSDVKRKVASTTNVIGCNLLHTVVHRLQSGDDSQDMTVLANLPRVASALPDLILKEVETAREEKRLTPLAQALQCGELQAARIMLAVLKKNGQKLGEQELEKWRDAQLVLKSVDASEAKKHLMEEIESLIS